MLIFRLLLYDMQFQNKQFLRVCLEAGLLACQRVKFKNEPEVISDRVWHSYSAWTGYVATTSKHWQKGSNSNQVLRRKYACPVYTK